MAPMHKLPPTAVRTKGAGKFGDGQGLWLVKSSKDTGKWVLRYVTGGRRREMGLGSIQDVSLAQARDLAAQWRSIAAVGKDPIKEREAAEKQQRKADTTLATITRETFEARKADLKGDGIAGRWMSPLELHVLPRLGATPIGQIDQRDIKDLLAPLWHTKADTARKALNRLGLVFKHAAAMGIEVDLQAVDKARALLGRSRHKAEHIPALDWQDVPAFYASLEEPSITHLALRLLILTGLRSAPIRFLRLEQIEGDIWTIPGERMKGLHERTPDFRLPLSSEALKVIDLARRFERDGFLFPSMRKGVISDATMSRLMERRGMVARPHGFRSSLRNWAAEATDARFEAAETLLAHTVGSKVARAYLRTDWLDERRVLIERWADYVCGKSNRQGMTQ